MEVVQPVYADDPEVSHRHTPKVPFSDYHPKSDEPPYPAHVAGDTAQRQRLCGLGLPILCLIIFLCLATIGVAVAAGIEGARASTSTSCSACPTMSSSVSPTATPASPATDRGCAAQPYNGTYTALNGGSFQIYCLKDYVGNDILAVISPSFEACIETCASWNQKLAGNGVNVTECSAAVFVPTWYNATGAVGTNPVGSCFLKKGLLDYSQLGDTTGKETDVAIRFH
jgi:hypothetical protein